MNSVSTHITCLDTTGRPAITLKYEQLTDRHTGVIYVSALALRLVLFYVTANHVQVSYKVPFSAHLTKPIAVATALMGLFVLAFGWRRVDTRIQK